VNDSNSEIDRLRAEFIATRKEIDVEIKELSTHWGITVGSLPVYVSTTTAIALIYGTFLVACFAAGIAFTFLSGAFASLGIALIVGALFAGGAIVAQVWSFAVQEEHDLFYRALGDERTKDLQKLGTKLWQLKKRYDQLQNETSK
jgi:hypothetical protein